MSGYPEGHVERFAAARAVTGEAPPFGYVALKLEGKVSMKLETYEALTSLIADQRRMLDGVKQALE